MLVSFFFLLREGGLKVSITEFLTLLELLKKRLIKPMKIKNEQRRKELETEKLANRAKNRRKKARYASSNCKK